ncbi:hypothetical protein SNEBB_001569 [Seison nebaliae]|nr:hypothetical protein SNEBB_001569 [Seison nebaliae]
MSNLVNETPIPVGWEIIRDPFHEPPSILNDQTNSNALVVLQLLMASAPLMRLLFEHNHCDAFNCFQIKSNIGREEHGKCNLIKDIEYSYLVHEVMVMMGFRQMTKERGCTCNKHPTSTGCKIPRETTSHTSAINGSMVLRNLFRLYAMRKCPMVAAKEIRPDQNIEFLKTIETKSVRKEDLTYFDKLRNHKEKKLDTTRETWMTKYNNCWKKAGSVLSHAWYGMEGSLSASDYSYMDFKTSLSGKSYNILPSNATTLFETHARCEYNEDQWHSFELSSLLDPKLE